MNAGEDYASELRSSPMSPLNTEAITQSNMSDEDIHQALLAVMVRKDELQETNTALKGMLECEQERTKLMTSEIQELKEKVEKQEQQIQLQTQQSTRETEVLRNQLKKYVGVVQTLQRNTDNKTPDSPEPPPPNNHVNNNDETEAFEKKLIELTEMHAELMEFNEHLHSRLKFAVNLLRNMRTELIDLRGPMPSDDLMYQVENDQGLVVTDAEHSTSSRALINIWMPTVTLEKKRAKFPSSLSGVLTYW